MKTITLTQLAMLLLGTSSFCIQAAPTPLEQRIAHGEYLSRAGDCAACHTAP